jgi:hypothetical protein
MSQVQTVQANTYARKPASQLNGGRANAAAKQSTDNFTIDDSLYAVKTKNVQVCGRSYGN